MVRCVSLFSQPVALFSRVWFHRLVVKHGADGYCKSFSSRDHFVAMLLSVSESQKPLMWWVGPHHGKESAFGNEGAPKQVHYFLCR